MPSPTADQVVALLVAHPGRLAQLSADAPPQALHARPAADQWSADEVLAHLRACADEWGGCIQRILREDEPTLRARNPRAWAERTDYRDQGFRTSLDAFTAQREDLVAVLAPLPPDRWARTATVTGAGRPLVRSVLDYAQRLAVHERAHVRQVERALAAVGS